MSPAALLVRGSVDGRVVVELPLPHGAEPEALLRDRGWFAVRPRAASLVGSGGSDGSVGSVGSAVAIEYAVRAAPVPEPSSRPTSAGVDMDPGLALAEGVEPVRRQRLSAVVLVQASYAGEPSLLVTSYNARTRWDGFWGLPGGGVDAGEEPAAAARRECWEETGQDVAVGDLLAVQSAHWVGVAPSGVVEDFHAVRLVYRGTCAAPGPPEVHDVDGTTGEAAWVPLSRLGELRWGPAARDQLAGLGLLP